MTSLSETPIPGGWTERTIVLGEREFRLLVPRSPDAFLSELPETWDDGDQPLDPYWAQLWPAASTLAEYVLRFPFPPGSEVLELGCGIGLVGLAALAAGCNVVFSDLAETAVQLALENAARNGFSARPLVGGSATPRGDKTECSRASGLVFDWRRPPLLPRFRHVLASDVLYYSSEHSALLDVLERVLARDGECWIGDPGRSAAADFADLACQRGFRLSQFDPKDRPLPRPAFGEYRRLVLSRAIDQT